MGDEGLNRAASHCPRCMAEYREGFDTCADCGIGLVAGPAPVTEEHAPQEVRGRRHPVEDRDDRPVVLCRLPQIEAQVLVGKLQGEGLVASIEGSGQWTVYGLSISTTAGIRVWVLESQLERARAVARHALGGEDAI